MDAELDRALARWESALGTLRIRVSAEPANRDATLTRLIEAGESESEAFSSALGRLEEAQNTLEEDLDRAWRVVSAAFSDAMSAAEARQDADALRSLRWQRVAERRKGDALREQLGRSVRRIVVEARADAARACHAAAARDWETPATCGSCGAPLEVGAVYEPTSFRCGRCNAVTEVMPSPATQAYLRPARIESLAEEAHFPDLLEMEAARRQYAGWLHPITADFEAFEQLARRTWMGWADTLLALHPGWTPLRAREEGSRRLEKTLGPWQSDSATERREVLARGSALLRQGDQRGVLDLAHSRREGAARFLDDLSVCLHEHEDRGAAWQCLALAHHVARIPTERDSWMRERIGELDEALRTR